MTVTRISTVRNEGLRYLAIERSEKGRFMPIIYVNYLISYHEFYNKLGWIHCISRFAERKKHYGQTDGPTDPRTHGRTNPLIEMRGRI